MVFPELNLKRALPKGQAVAITIPTDERANAHLPVRNGNAQEHGCRRTEPNPTQPSMGLAIRLFCLLGVSFVILSCSPFEQPKPSFEQGTTSNEIYASSWGKELTTAIHRAKLYGKVIPPDAQTSAAKPTMTARENQSDLPRRGGHSGQLTFLLRAGVFLDSSRAQ